MNTRNYMSFAGWTDKAYIYAQATPSCTIARHRGRKILVSGANKYIGETCLVRFGLKESDMEPDPITNFISSNVPETFQGSPPESYIFTALWEFSMKKTGNIPTYREMNQYFEPGSLTWFYYLTKNSSKKGGRMRVNQNSYSAQCVSLPKIIKRGLPDPSRSSRLIIANSKERLEEVTNAIEQENLMAIQLEPIDTLETNS